MNVAVDAAWVFVVAVDAVDGLVFGSWMHHADQDDLVSFVVDEFGLVDVAFVVEMVDEAELADFVALVMADFDVTSVDLEVVDPALVREAWQVGSKVHFLYHSFHSANW